MQGIFSTRHDPAGRLGFGRCCNGLLALVLTVSIGAAPLNSNCDAAHAADAERTLAAQPAPPLDRQAELRAALIEFYWTHPASPSATERRREHLLWMIEHRPGAALTPAEAWSWNQSDAGAEEIQVAWVRQLAIADAPAAALANGAWTLARLDPERALDWLQRAAKKSPDHAVDYSWQAGVVMADAMAGVRARTGPANEPVLDSGAVARLNPVWMGRLTASHDPTLRYSAGWHLSHLTQELQLSGVCNVNYSDAAESIMQEALGMVQTEFAIFVFRDGIERLQRSAKFISQVQESRPGCAVLRPARSAATLSASRDACNFPG